jgi:hypothetical protein
MAGWPRPETIHRRSSSVFSAPWAQTERDLIDEASRLGADEVIIAVDCDERDLRRDAAGLLRGAKIRSPRIVVYMETKHGPMSFPVDAFDSWRSNVRAVALGLHDLRRLDRYGMADGGQQYTGFAALPPGSNLKAEDPAALIARIIDAPLDAVMSDPRRAGRIALAKAHPDAPGGDNETFLQVKAAVEAVSA